jgi:hypothetical protein
VRVPRFALFLVLAPFLVLALITQFAVAQQTTTSSPQPLVLLQKSLAALGGAQTLTDVTLSGTARRIAGSDDDTGTAVFKALASGAGRTDLSLSSGQRSEVQSSVGANLSSPSGPAGTWSGPDRISHPIAFHNSLSESAWFFPAFAIARRLSASGLPAGAGYVTTYIAHETRNGQSVEHISVSQTPSSQDAAGAPTLQHLTQVDFFLDSSTLLPAAISFNTHPDNDAGLDIPAEVRFSDYRAVAPASLPASSLQVPFHVQKYLNNSLILDFQAQTVTFNTGLAASSFSL